jgi:hypothetical protein
MIYIEKKAKELFSEPCFKIFKHKVYFCLIFRNMDLGTLNGYVAVPKNNKFFKKEYFNQNEISNLEVHGGVTYTGDTIFNSKEILGEELWWIGFDTAHFSDLVPFQNFEAPPCIRDGEYRNFEYVVEQTKQLAEQIFELSQEEIR